MASAKPASDRSEHTGPAGSTASVPAAGDLAPRGRFLGLLGAWTLQILAMPGALFDGGSVVLAILGVAWWGAVSVRPLGERRRRALLVEWLANSIGGGATMWWIYYVTPPGVLYIGAGLGAYLSIGGAFARALARRFPVGASVALGWLGAETLRTVLLPPLGLGWFLLGFYAHDDFLLSESARVWGVEGLTFVLAALGGVGAELIARRACARGTLALAASAVVLAVVLGAVTSPPETRLGPRLLLVQPYLPQAEKQLGDPRRNDASNFRYTLDELARREAAGEPPVDLVCWGETMFQSTRIVEEAAVRAFDAGVPPLPWWEGFDRRQLEIGIENERRVVREVFLPALPDGVSFLAGVISIDDVGGAIGPRNAVALWSPNGERAPAAGKRYLVPGAETMLGLERWEWVRDAAFAAMGYVPEFRPAERTGVLEFTTRDGATYALAATVCFDNSFLEAYTEPLSLGPVDFHLVATNEDWYHDAFELDQMIAFSRVAALATGRAVVRAANSGITCMLGPDGRELARLRVGGRDRSVRGTLAVDVPVPASETPSNTPYVAIRGPLRWGIGVALALLLGASRAGRRSHPETAG